MAKSVAVSFVLLTLIAASAFGQAYSPIGARATGLGGAWVAVADDATAVHWNPAGLALGPRGGLFSYGDTGRVRDDLSARMGMS